MNFPTICYIQQCNSLKLFKNYCCRYVNEKLRKKSLFLFVYYGYLSCAYLLSIYKYRIMINITIAIKINHKCSKEGEPTPQKNIRCKCAIHNERWKKNT